MNQKLTISTWIHCDYKNLESVYPNNSLKISSSKSFQNVYWRCCFNFFYTSLRVNSSYRHVLFTNSSKLPIVDGFDLEKWFRENGIEVIKLPLTYITPENYYLSWKNQFYIFDILKYITEKEKNELSSYIILDSDCVWTHPVTDIAERLKLQGVLPYEINYPINYNINGLTKSDIKLIYSEMGISNIEQLPNYFGGEWFAATSQMISLIYKEFHLAWTDSLKRFGLGQKKLNEEAHFLSYIYYKLGFKKDAASIYIKRMWTNPLGRKSMNVNFDDLNLPVWHLPGEKTFGLDRLFKLLTNSRGLHINKMNNLEFREFLAGFFGIPKKSFYILFSNIFKKIKLKLFQN